MAELNDVAEMVALVIIRMVVWSPSSDVGTPVTRTVPVLVPVPVRY